MASYNDVTGDKIQSRVNNKQFEDNFDKIFRKEKAVTPDWGTEKDEKRMDIIGSNGPVGYDEDTVINKVK